MVKSGYEDTICSVLWISKVWFDSRCKVYTPKNKSMCWIFIWERPLWAARGDNDKNPKNWVFSPAFIVQTGHSFFKFTYFFIYKFFLAAPHGMWHLSSPPTTPPALEGGVLITSPPGKSPDWAFVPCIFLIDNIHSLSKHFLSRIYRREWKSQYNRWNCLLHILLKKPRP